MGDHEISKAEARHPQVLDELERQLRRTTGFAAVTVIPTALSAMVLLWQRSETVGLLVWVGVVVLNSLHWLVHLRTPPEGDWLQTAKPIHMLGGACWGLLPVVAMPNDPAWQLFVAAFLLGVQASNVLFSSQLRQMYYRFHLPLTVLAATGFLVSGEGPGRWGAALLIYSGFFAAGLSEINHATELSAAVMAFRSSELAAGLEQEREALSLANEQLAAIARTDPLTGLANRLDFTDLLSEALANAETANGANVAVAYIDLDGFKAVNDAQGHRVGDLLLVAVAKRLSATLLDGEILARLGGDELVVLSSAATDEHELDELGERLGASFDDPFSIEGRRLEIGASIGVAAATASTAPDELLRFADTALYQGKARPGTVVEVFDSSMLGELRRKDELEAELEEAMPAQHLSPWLQPIVDPGSGHIRSAEALVRWEHHDGVRTAASFLEAAANRGLVGQISERVLADVIDYRLAVLARGIEPLDIAVNVAPHHLEMILDRFGSEQALDGITIEVTEEAVFASLDLINELIGQAHELGAKVVLDDFGTGFSSLSMAMDLHVDGYKIDRRFVAGLCNDPSAEAVVAAVVRMAGAQGRTVVAEGVESAEQASLLTDLGVTAAQGFLYSAAVPLAQFDTWLADGRSPSWSADQERQVG